MTKPTRILLMFSGGLAVLAALLVMLNANVFAQTGSEWRGEYYDNPNMLGTPRFIRYDPQIAFNWWDGSPGGGIPNDNFSVRWARDQHFNKGTYRFAATMDDGMRVYLDDQLIIDNWFLSAAHTESKDVNVTPGIHVVTVEYFEGTGQAEAAVTINQVTAPPIGGGNGGDPNGAFPNWKAEYFTNQSASGAPAVVRDDRYINFDWGTGSPVPGVIPADHFSTRWTRTGNYPSGQYKLRLTSDDGSRLYINGVEIINNWGNPILQPVEASYWHPGGPATIRVDYYDVTGKASIRLDLIQVPGGSGVVPPTGYPGGSGSGGGGVVYPGTGGSGSGGGGVVYPGTGGSGSGTGGGGTVYVPPTPTATPIPTIPQCPGKPYPVGLTAVVISPSNLNIRRDPTTMSESFGQFASCSTLPLTGYRDVSGQWVQTVQNGVSGWVTTQYVVLGVPLESLLIGP